MRKELFQKIDIPEGVEAEINKGLIKINGSKGENQRELKLGKINMEKNEKKISNK